MSGNVLIEARADRVLTLTMNRPERKNALSPELYEQLLSSLERASCNLEVGAVILTGAGGGFCSGGDVSRMAGVGQSGSAEERMDLLRVRTRIVELLHAMPKPTIAMVQGAAIGAGLSLATACDLRYGDATARFRTGFVDVGLSGDFGGHYFLPRIVGAAKTREMYLVSRTIDAVEAVSIGLLNRIYDGDQLEAEVMSVARDLAARPGIAVRYLKRNLDTAFNATLPEVLDAEVVRHVRCTQTDDHREAAAAFVERRKPVFRGT